MNESNLQRLITLHVPKSVRIFRNNTGMGWIGQVVSKTPTTITLKNPRPLHAGLCTGSSDLIGWKSVVITPDMVGKTIAAFTAVEVKTSSGRATADQLNFIEQVRKAGGIAGIVRSPEEARNFLESYL